MVEQPGIGTYIESKSLSHTSVPARLNSWLQKSKDSAVGSSFDKHVMQAYQFLMRYYSSGDGPLPRLRFRGCFADLEQKYISLGSVEAHTPPDF